jgi:cytochrome c553
MCWPSRGKSMTPRWRRPGRSVFADNCAACHMEDGTGDRAQGAPKLTDAIWLYGGSREAIIETVTYARFGVMPDWNERLSEDEIRAVAFLSTAALPVVASDRCLKRLRPVPLSGPHLPSTARSERLAIAFSFAAMASLFWIRPDALPPAILTTTM